MNKPAMLRNHALRYSKVFSNAAVAFGLCLAANTALAQTNFLSNGGVESGVPGLWVTNVVDWAGSSSGGDLVNGGATESHGGVNYIRMNAYGLGARQFSQRFPLTAGQVYSADAWMRTESGANAFNPTSGYAGIVLQFFDTNGFKIGANVEAPYFGAGGPTSWTSYGTGPALAPAGTVSGRVLAVYQGFGLDLTTNGYVRFDDFRATTNTATQAGALKNPDFETQPAGTLAANNIPYWTALGNAGAVITNVHRNGRFSFNVYYTENLLAQTWAATSGVRYMSEGYINSLGITTTNNARGLIIMDFLDATGTNILATYLGAAVTNGSPTNSWILSHAEGIAPPGTVFGRTLCAVIGADDGFAGNLYFDDLTQATVASSATTCGVISNPGFDDGLTGNATAL